MKLRFNEKQFFNIKIILSQVPSTSLENESDKDSTDTESGKGKTASYF